jgi:hypothetical protein
MYDPAQSGLFLHTNGDPNGPIYNEPIEFGDQFFWDFRNESARLYFVQSVLSTLQDDAVDGTFSDDVGGVPEEHPDAPKNTGLSDTDLANLRYATQETSQSLITNTVLAGKFNWQAFGAEDGVPGGPSGKGDGCIAYMRTHCDPAYQARPMLMGMDNSPANANQTVAAFLVSRPPHAYLGWGWESDDKQWNDIFYLQVGTPLGLCSEDSQTPGVFSRVYTAGTAVLDCNQWTASLPFPSMKP